MRLIGPDYFDLDAEEDELGEINELWVQAKVEGEDVMFCLDSGASRVIMKSEQYWLIPECKRPELMSKNVLLKQADGSTFQIDGVALLNVQVGECNIKMPVYVAPVSDNLLGLNFLRKVCAQVDLDRLQLVIGDQRIDCRSRDNKPLYARVVAACDIRVPGEHEIVVLANVSGEWVGSKLGVLVPVNRGELIESNILVARGVVNAMSVNVPVRLMNLGEREKVIRRGTVLAKMFPVQEDEIQILHVTEESIELESGIPEHLLDMIERCCGELEESEVEKVVSLLTEYQDVFSTGEFDIGHTDLIRHSIDTQGAHPIRQRLRRSSPEQRTEVERQVKELKERGLIQPSDSAWASPVVLVGKKDGSKRLCIDYRKLNELTVKDAYPLPRIDDSLDALGGAKYFSTLDLAAGYWQVEMSDDARAKSAFVTTSGLYEWKVLPFGLCNAPSTFERLMDYVLAGLKWETLLVYLDDVIVFGGTVTESVERLREVLTRFRGAGLKLKPSKCHLFQSKVHYLGHVVSQDGVHTDPGKIEAIRDWPIPVTRTQVRSFLGTTGYYRRFVRDYANIAQPLHKLSEKAGAFVWSEECQEAFDKLKNALISAPILAYPREEGEYILDTDASNFAIGCVLSQVQDGEEKVIAYGSKALKKEERNYCVTRRELLAVVEFLKKYRHYLGGRPVRVRTDHGSLRWLLNFKNPEQQLARWLEVCATFNLTLEHRPGKQHQNADGLSRRPCKQCGRWEKWWASQEDERKEAEIEAEIMSKQRNEMKDVGIQTIESPIVVSQGTVECDTEPASPEESICEEMPTISSLTLKVQSIPEVSLKSLREAQLSDETMGPLLRWKETGERPDWKVVSNKSPALKSYWSQWDMMAVRDGVLVKRWESNDGKEFKWLLVLPHALRKKVLDTLHSSKTAGHLGREKTLPKVREKFYWFGLSADVRSYVRKCVDCARKKGTPRKHRAPLQQLHVGGPLERIAVDVLGPLTETHRGNMYILVVGDYWTKWMEAYPIPDQQAETVASKIVEEFVCRFGVPHELHSDQGRNFESEVFSEMCRILGINKTRTTPYNPKSDGFVERYNRTIVNAVSLMILPYHNQKDWDEYVPFVGMAYRSSVQASSGETPNMMMLGRDVSTPIDLMFSAPPDEKECNTDYAEDLRDKIRDMHERARHALEVSSRRQKRFYDRRTCGPVYQEGQFVWLYRVSRRKNLSRKLMMPWEGPFLIVKILSDVTYRIQRTARSKPQVVHADRLKPYEGPELRPWKYVSPESVEQDDQENKYSGAQQSDPLSTQSVDSDVPQNESPSEVNIRTETPQNDPQVEGGDTDAPPSVESDAPQSVDSDASQNESLSEDNIEHDAPPSDPQVESNDDLPTPSTPLRRRNPPRNRRRPARYT